MLLLKYMNVLKIITILFLLKESAIDTQLDNRHIMLRGDTVSFFHILFLCWIHGVDVCFIAFDLRKVIIEITDICCFILGFKDS